MLVSVSVAKRILPKLIKKVLQGEAVTITKNGVPMVDLIISRQIKK